VAGEGPREYRWHPGAALDTEGGALEGRWKALSWGFYRRSVRRTVKAVNFRLLGPLEVRAGDGPVPIGGPKQRTLLALLVLQPNRVVTVDRLTDAIWGSEPPATARNTLQTYVRHLRKALGAGGSSTALLVTCSSRTRTTWIWSASRASWMKRIV
jgi:hypothetical protein